MGNRYIDVVSGYTTSPCSSSSWFGYSAFCLIFPYIEGNARYNAINFNLVANSIRNVTALASKLNTYICPSDLAATPFVDANGITRGYTQCSYGMSRGTQENIFLNWAYSTPPDYTQPNAQHCNAALGNGMFGAEDVIKISGVTDGTSNTTLFGEMSRFKNEPGGPLQLLLVHRGVPRVGLQSQRDQRQRVFPPDRPFTLPRINSPNDLTGQNWTKVFGVCGTQYAIPTDWLVNCPQALTTLGEWSFRSFHPGGCNFAFADGSVKFIKQTIGDATYQALGTRAGGEVISADAY